MKIGSTFTGYGGLDMAVSAVTGASTAWVSDIPQYDKKGAMVGNAPGILAHRHPGVPNLGDITRVDWSSVKPVEIFTGGFPCQDVSHSGRGAGLIRGKTRSGLWAHMVAAIDTIRPRLVVAENVRGLLSARADSDVEPCPWCLGDPTASPVRALGAVLADLADIGYDARWYGLPLSSIGGCHGRFRVFIAAYPQGDPWWLPYGDGGGAVPTAGPLPPTPMTSDSKGAAAGDLRRHGPQLRAIDALLPTPRASDRFGAGAHGAGGPDLRTALSLLPTPRATDGAKGGPGQRGSKGDLALPSAAVRLLPTPAASNPNDGEPVESWLERRERVKLTAQNGNGMGTPLSVALRLLPTPTTEPATGNGHARDLGREAQLEQFGEYAAAIASHERLVGRPTPEPTELGPKGRPRLAARFVEWMQTIPDGWVTEVPGLTRSQQLHALGNGVAPLQAVAALRYLGDPRIWKESA